MPSLADAPEQKCPRCGNAVAVAELEPLTRVECPHCGEKFRVERAFDNFVIVESLGVGGMGAVYKAKDTRLERFVALKLLRKELSANPDEAARLEQEARVTAAVNHPNVVQVYSSGTAHGQIYLVMELVDHGSLDDLMAQHTRVPEAQVLRAGIQVARGLQAAHEKGLIHRDVKPANILFSDAQTAKIGDFGLAGVAEEKAEAQKEIWGTPYYVAPERLNNEREDFRSDIYSLGATLFHALAGKPPMEGESTSASELRQLKAHPPDLRAVAPDVSRETARVINRTLAPDPANRFATYAELVEGLVRAYRAISGESQTKKRTVIGVVIALALIAAAVAGWFALHKRAAAIPAVVTTSSPMPSASPDNTAALEQRLNDARRVLIDGKYDQAAAAFGKIAAEASKRQPIENWARLHVGITALLQKKPGPARDAFQQVERAGPFSNTPLASFFVETSRSLAASGPIPASNAASIDSKSVSAFALFLYGIKDWQLSQFDEAATFFNAFATAEPPNEFSWINDYKAMAKKFLDDHRLYTDWKQSSGSLTSLSDLRSGAAKLKSMQGKLKLTSALSDRFKEEEKRVNRTLAAREKEEQQTREQKDADEFERQKPIWLAEWKSRLVEDLKTGSYRAPITMGPTTYDGVVSATDSDITLRIGAYGGTAFKWDKIPPNVLLSMATSFIHAGAPDAADRQWRAAVFANSTGQIDAARTLAEAAAKTKPEYQAQTKLLLRPSS